MRRTMAMAMVGLLLAVGCSAGPDVTAGESDNGGHVELDIGDTFDIVIGDDYSTSNAQWRDEERHDTAVLKYLGSKYEPDRTPPGGSHSGVFTSRYEAVTAGTVHVTLVQEGNANPPHVARRYALDVTVH